MDPEYAFQDTRASSSTRPAPRPHRHLPQAAIGPHVVHDFRASSDTPERHARDALLRPACGTVAVHGPLGTGKTTLLLALCLRDDVTARFSDAVWYFNAADYADDFLREVLGFVSECCTPDAAASFRWLIADEATWCDAMVGLARVLREMRALLVFDDVAGCVDEVGWMVRVLVRELGACESGSKLLVCTGAEPLEYIAKFVRGVSVGPLEAQGHTSRRILFQAFGGGPGGNAAHALSDQAKDAVSSILNVCKGVATYLFMAGRAARSLVGDGYSTEKVNDAWEQFYDIEREVLATANTGMSLFDGEEVFAVIQGCLLVLKKTWPDTCEVLADDALKAFCIVPRNMVVPTRIVTSVLQVETNKFIALLDRFGQHGLVSGYFDNEHVNTPKLLHQCSVEMAKQSRDRRARQHAKVIRFCCDSVFRDNPHSTGDSLQINSEWDGELGSRFEPLEARYLRRNIIRHLLRCQMHSLALELICHYRWIDMFHGIDEEIRVFGSALHDFSFFLESPGAPLGMLNEWLESTGEAADYESVLLELRYLQRAILRSSSRCVGNRNQRAFQLLSLIYGLNSKARLVPILLQTILAYARPLSLLPPVDVLPRANNMLKRVLVLGFSVQKLACMPNNRELLVGGACGELVVIDKNTGNTTHSLIGHTKWISGLAVYSTTKEVFSSSWDGSIRVWREGKQVQEFWPFKNEYVRHADVSCMALLEREACIACASEFGTVRLLDMSTGLCRTNLPVPFGNAWDLVVSPNGTCLVGGFSDGTCCMWKSRGTSSIQPESRKTLLRDARGEQRFAFPKRFEEDRVYVSRGSCDRQAIQSCFISETSRTVIQRSAPISTMGRIEAMVYNRKGDVLFTASSDGTVRAWSSSILEDRATESANKFLERSMQSRPLGTLRYHEGSVTSLALSEDAKELLSGAEDGLVCVWNTPHRFERFYGRDRVQGSGEDENNSDSGVQVTTSATGMPVDSQALSRHFSTRKDGHRKQMTRYDFSITRNDTHSFGISESGSFLVTIHTTNRGLVWKREPGQRWHCPRWKQHRDFSLHSCVAGTGLSARVCVAVTVSEDGSTVALATSENIFVLGTDFIKLRGPIPSTSLDRSEFSERRQVFIPDSLSISRPSSILTLVGYYTGDSKKRTCLRWGISAYTENTGPNSSMLPEPLSTTLATEIQDSWLYLNPCDLHGVRTFGREVFCADITDGPIAVLETQAKSFIFNAESHRLWILTAGGFLYSMEFLTHEDQASRRCYEADARKAFRKKFQDLIDPGLRLMYRGASSRASPDV